ncbi:hypothetical protein [Rufibacter roseus]|uniref:Uncharacterized protein n=1 Tax=Rufibacter roseus TaxID=1567108 RepID=A0ABW2DSK1_9BACT|nr:hypothetical protein [Rufibacter roseus]
MSKENKAPEQEQLTPEQEIARLRQQLADKDAILDETVQALKNAEAAKGSSLPVVSFEDEQYRLLAAKANIKGKVYTAAEVAESKELIQHLIKIKSGLLQKIEATEEESNA